ncbi:MAG: hypothetical protein ACLP4W_09950 [Mycobacterium sp.]|uniref:hypothetical protein n=1 Tax=Mycobacterium sp. TaxID=1785 RepID=UPI003F9C23A5
MSAADTTLEVYCDDPSHEGRSRVVAVLARGDDGFWHGVRHHGRGTGSAVQLLADDDRMTGRHPDADPDDDNPVGERLRVRYRLRCRCEVLSGRRCGRAVELREENAVPVFEKLVANNIHSISLAALAAIV